MQQYQ